MAFVQAQNGWVSFQTSVTTGAMNTTTGNMLIAYMTWRLSGSGAVSSITDSAGNVWEPFPDSPLSGPNDQISHLYYCTNIVGMVGHTVTVTTTASHYKSIIVMEFSGRNPRAIAALKGYCYNTETTATNSHSGPPTGRLIDGTDVVTFGGMNADTSSATVTFTPTNGWTIPANGSVANAWACVGLYKENCPDTSISATYTNSGNACQTAQFVVVMPPKKDVLLGQTGDGWTLTETPVQQASGNGFYYAAGYTAAKTGTASWLYFKIPRALSASYFKVFVYEQPLDPGKSFGAVKEIYATAVNTAGWACAFFRQPFTVIAGRNYKLVVVTDTNYMYAYSNQGAYQYDNNQISAGNAGYTSMMSTLPAFYLNQGPEIMMWIEGVAQTSTSWTTKRGLNFRSTKTFVSDAADEIAVLDEDYVTGGGVCVRWPNSYSINGTSFKLGFGAQYDGARNRVTNVPSSSDHRLAGQHGPYGGGTLRIQLGTAPGRYRIWAAYTDQGYADTVSRWVTLRDQNTTLLSWALPARQYASQVYDVLGNRYANGAAWAAAADGAGMAFEFETFDISNGNGGPMLYIDLGVGNSNGVPLSHFAVKYLGTSNEMMIGDTDVTSYNVAAAWLRTQSWWMPWVASDTGVLKSLAIYCLMNGYVNQLKLMIADSTGRVLGVTATHFPSGSDCWAAAPLTVGVPVVAGTTYYLGFVANNNDGGYAHAAGGTYGVYTDAANGDFSAPPSQVTFSWATGSRKFLMYGTGVKDSGGAMTPTYTLSNVQASDTGTLVEASAADGTSSVLSNIVTLTVQALQKLKLMLIGVG